MTAFEKAILPDQLYSDNKTKLKTIYKKHGLKFNQGALHNSNLFLWQGEGVVVQGIFTKDEHGVTTHSELLVKAKERTDLFDDLKEAVENIGGTWEIVPEEVLVKEEEAQKLEEIESFEKSMWTKLFNEERKARKQGFEHCPVMKGLITEQLTERHKRFGLTDLTPWDVLAEVYAVVDSEVVE